MIGTAPLWVVGIVMRASTANDKSPYSVLTPPRALPLVCSVLVGRVSVL